MKTEKIHEKFYPFIFEPIYIEKPWGGSNLNQKQGVGEAFLISDFENQSTTCNGKTISELTGIFGPEFLGSDIYFKYKSKLPVYLKEIDTIENLSIQVHPDNKHAKLFENENFGKNESWYILSATTGSGIYLGFKSHISEIDFQNAINNNIDISELLNFIPVSSGDFFYIPAGIIHAIGKGIRLLEPQQNSNCTYRIWDWNRVDINGNKRELHLEKATKVINFDKFFNFEYSKKILLNSSNFFKSDFFNIDFYGFQRGTIKINNEEKVYKILTAINGDLSVTFDNGKKYFIKPGRACIVPAFIEELMISFLKNANCLIVTPK